MDRRAFIWGAMALLGGPLAAQAQQAGKIPRIGWLSVGSASREPAENLEAFRRGLQQLGYVEGRSITIEYRYAEGRQDRLPELAAELVRLKVDIIVAVPTPATLAARTATAVTPILMIQSADPVGLGLVASLGRPGGNISGIVTLSTELIGKRLELLKESVPGLSRIAVLAQPDTLPMPFCSARLRRQPKPSGSSFRSSRCEDLPISTPCLRRLPGSAPALSSSC